MHIIDEIFVGSILVLITILLHITCLVYLSSFLTKRFSQNKYKFSSSQIIGAMSILVSSILMLHAFEALVWAYVYWLLGEFTQFSQALYFSIVTATTLGYGDITLSDKWQLLGPWEAMGGLILFAVSTAFLIDVLKVLFEKSHE